MLLGRRLQARAKAARLDELGAQPAGAGELQDAGVGDIGEDDARLGGELAAVDRVGDRAEVRALAGTEDAELQHWLRRKVAVVDLPGTSGRMRNSAPASCNAATSSGCSVASV